MLSVLGSLLLEATTTAYNTTISALAKGQQWRRALEVLLELRKSMKLEVISMNAAMTACGRGKVWRSAQALLTCLSAEWLEADLISYNAALHALEGAQWSLSCYLFGQLTKSLQADAIARGLLLDAFVGSQEWSLALGVWMKLREQGYLPDLMLCNSGAR